MRTDIASTGSIWPARSGRRFWTTFTMLAFWIAVFSTLAWAQDTTTRVSLGAGGVQGDNSSMCATLSADGRYVAFASYASNLVSDDTNGVADIFVHDRATGTTTRASVSSQGVQGNDNTNSCPAISGDGRYVAFASMASNLVAGDTNGFMDVFVHDTATGETTLVSVGDGGGPADERSYRPAISADGRFVAFESYATNLVADDTNNTMDVFVRDRSTGTTTRVSVSSEGVQGNSTSFSAALSADGHLVAFVSTANNLVTGDTTASVFSPGIFVHELSTGVTTREAAGIEPALSADGHFVAFRTAPSPSIYKLPTNVYMRDRVTGTTTLVSAKTRIGTYGDGDCYAPAISADGRFVAFASDSSLIITDDTNYSTDIFIYDKSTSTISRASVGSGGEQANGGSGSKPAISADGRFVAFDSNASNLVPGDTNSAPDVFVHDRKNDAAEMYLAVAIDPGWLAAGTVTGPGINCPGDCLETFTSLQTVTLTAAPATGYTFDNWTGCDSVAGDQCTVTMNGTKHVTARFTETSPALTAQIYPGDMGDYTACTSTATCGGTVFGTGINCPGDCSEPYSPSQTVTITAIAKPGYVFKQWPYYFCDVTVANQCTVTMTRSRMVVAEFATGLTVSVNPANGGTVTGWGIACPGDCVEYYSPYLGDTYHPSGWPYTATVTATAQPGYTFSGWTGCTSVSGSQCSVLINSPKSVAATFTTQATPPTAPTNLSATPASSSQIDLGWMNTATNATNILVERSANGTTFIQIASLAAAATSYQDTGLTASTGYYYRVRASNSAGYSGYSNLAMATTTAPPTPPPTAPAVPTNLTGVAVSATEIRLTWGDNANNESGFAIERSTNSTSGFAQIATVSASSTSASTYTDSGLAANMFYYYRVRAFNAAGSSAYSNVVKVKTPRK